MNCAFMRRYMCMPLWTALAAFLFLQCQESLSLTRPPTEGTHLFDSPLNKILHPIDLNFPRGMFFPRTYEANVVGSGNASIEPYSHQFIALFRFYDHPKILFKGDPDEDYLKNHNYHEIYETKKKNPNHYIHPQMADRLNVLSDLITQEYPHLRLRITSSIRFQHEKLGKSNPHSLHHVGRAIDLTLYDYQQQLRLHKSLGWLAQKALKAGFDWVYHEKTHIHASIKSLKPYDHALFLFRPGANKMEPTRSLMMRKKADGWYERKVLLPKGRTIFKIASEKGHLYGYHRKNYLGHDEYIDAHNGYMGSAFSLELKKKQSLHFQLNPEKMIFKSTIPLKPDQSWFLYALRNMLGQNKGSSSKHLNQ